MPRQCTVCAHPAKGEISVKQVRGVGAPTLASQYYPLSRSAIGRHKKECLPEIVEKGLAALEEHEREETEYALDVIRQLKEINEEAWSVLREVKESEPKDYDKRLRALDRVLNQLRYQSERIGEIDAITTRVIINSPTFIEFKQLVVRTLADHPEARRALVAHLGALEQGVVSGSQVLSR
jgi:hypothetical protein